MTWSESRGARRCSTASTRRSGKNANRPERTRQVRDQVIWNRRRRRPMNGTLPSISPGDLARLIGTAAAPIVLDIRSTGDAVDRLILGSIHRPQDDVEHLWRALPVKRPVVVCDSSGGQTSWMVVDALRRFGADA